MTFDDEEIKAELLGIADLAPEMRGLVDDLLEHIRNEKSKPLCGAKRFESSLLVTAALASDCDACRGARGVALVGEKQWDGSIVGQRPEPVYEAQPMMNAEEICASARRNRDG